VIRKQYQEYAEEQYKKAAAAARRAGDTNLELSILARSDGPGCTRTSGARPSVG